MPARSLLGVVTLADHNACSRRRGSLETEPEERLDPFDLRQPGRCALRVEPCLDPIRTDAGNAPAVATFERCPQLLLADGMWATGIRPDITETEHVQVPPTTRHGRQTRHVVSPLIAVAFSRAIDSAVSATSTPRMCSPVKGVLACPASCIEDCAGERAFVRQTQYRRLWSSNVPGRRAIEVRRIPRLTRSPLVTGWLPPAVRIVGSDSGPLGHLRSLPATGVAEPHYRMQQTDQESRSVGHEPQLG